MGDQEYQGRIRRRSAFEMDLREFVLKIMLGLVFGVVLRVWTGWDEWVAPLVIGMILSFVLAAGIRGSGRDSD